MTNDTSPPVAPVEGDYTIMPTKLAEALNALVPLANAVLDHADSHCRAFPIATAPTTGEWFLVWDNGMGEWFIHQPKPFDMPPNERYTHWRPLPPPPSNPPLPEVFVDLGAALEKIKGA